MPEALMYLVRDPGGVFAFDQPADRIAVATQLRCGECVFATGQTHTDAIEVHGGALAAGGDAARGDRGWVKRDALRHVDDSEHSQPWLRVTALSALGFAQPTRKAGPACVHLPCDAWVRGMHLLKSEQGGNPLDTSDWWHVALPDEHEVWVQAADFVTQATTMRDELARFLGRPYVWGGSDGHGLDCSGLVTHAARWRIEQTHAHTRHDFTLHGHPHWLPHSARRQFGEDWPALTKVGDDRTIADVAGDVSDSTEGQSRRRTLGEQAWQRWMPVVQPGDIAYFAMGGADKGRIDHVGFIETIADDGKVTLLHASSGGTGGQPQGPCVRRETLLPPEDKAFENKLAARWVGLRRFNVNSLTPK